MKSNLQSIKRRLLLQQLGLVALSTSFSAPIFAQSWPSQPIRLLVPYTTGSPPDLSSRILATYLSTALKQPVIVENKPGAIGLIALGELLRAPADGYTLYCMLTPVTTASTLMPAQKVDLATAIQPVSQVDTVASVLVVNNDLPATNIKEFVALLKAKPNELNFASTGSGTPAHQIGRAHV